MQSINRYLIVFAALSMFVLSGCATRETRSSASGQVSAAQQTLANFQNDPEMRWFRDNIGKARAVIISPRITRAGLVFGGSGGDALMLARGGGGWLGPAFYNIGAGSVGFQIGVDVSEVVILVMNERALNALLSRSLKLGADATISAGPVGAGVAANVTSDLVSFARSKGAYAGLSLDGTVIAPDNSANQAFYGRTVSPVDILVRGSPSSAGGAPLRDSIGRIAR